MRTILGISLSLLVVVFAAPSSAQSPVHFWSQRFGGTGDDLGLAVAVDGSGNVVVAGTFQNVANFGGGNFTSAGSYDIFLAKYSASGVHQWSRRFGSTGDDLCLGVAVDGSGNVAVTGRFNGTVNFGGANLVSAGLNDIFVAKYNASGVHQWSQRAGSPLDDVGISVKMDGPGNVVVTGYFQGTVNFGGANLVSAGSNDVFLTTYTASGLHKWSKRFGSTNSDVCQGVAVDGAGNVFVTGFFQGTVSFGGVNLVSAAGSTDIVLAKYDNAGQHQWSQRFGGTDFDTGNSVAVDGSGNVVMTGFFNATVNFGGGNLVSAGSYDVFMAKYNTNGVHQWSQRFGSTEGDQGQAVAVDGLGNVALIGTFNGTVNFGGGDLVSEVGSSAIFVARYNASGVHQWSFAGIDEAAFGVAAYGSGNVVLIGGFNGTVNFGGENLVSAGGNDIFVAKYGDNEVKPLITSILDIGNDQGKRVRIQFSSSDHDAVGAGPPVSRYEVYRRNDDLASAMMESPAGSPSIEQLLDLGWVYAADVPAHAANGYLIDASTDADSTIANGQHYSVFFIRASTASPGTFFDSPIDSGYSLDNLAPGAPTNLVLAGHQLYWSGPSATDFDYFTVYGSNSNNFGAASVIGYSVSPTLSVLGSTHPVYFVTATDFSGNESLPASTGNPTGVGETPNSYVLSVSAYPNPFNPETTVRYTVPAKGRVTLDVFDARGAHVATLVDAERDAGAHTVTWNGRDHRGTASGSGVYFARLTSPAGTRTYKMTLLK